MQNRQDPNTIQSLLIYLYVHQLKLSVVALQGSVMGIVYMYLHCAADNMFDQGAVNMESQPMPAMCAIDRDG